MQPLLKITSIPINLEYKVQQAALQQSTEPVKAEVSRRRGRAEIQTDPARVKINSYETRASMGMKTAARLWQEYAQDGRAAGLEATRNYAEQGNQLLDSHGKGNPIADIARAKTISTTQTIMAFIPSQQPEISVEGGSISFDYEMDKLTFDWDVSVRPQMEYVPGSLEISVAQYPQVIIEYLGGPMYVSPSADPNYVPLDASA